ncbi:hypothetical protein AGMMS49944_14320 [Spirochaetia bacterium]|nr:hypothetical protein AGMMS49944_14320 [Spirochaetia bacterium]
MKTFNMKHVRYTVGLVLLAGILALSGCVGPLSPKPVDNSSNGNGLLTITLGDTAKGGQTARTLYPAVTGFQSYVISFSHGSRSHANETFAPGETITVALDTDASPWTITVTAYTGTGGSGTAAASGSESVTMNGNAQTANITLTPITGGGTQGTFSYSIAFPSTISSAALTITTATGGAVTGGTITASSGNISAGTLNGTLSLDAGYYFMNLNLVNDTLEAGKTEVVHIYPGLTTAAVYSFTNDDLLPVLYGTVSTTGGSTPNPSVGQTLTAVTTSLEGTTTLSYQWKRGDTADGTFTNITTNGTGTSYTLTAADTGKYILVAVSRAGYSGSINSPVVYVDDIIINESNLDQMQSLIAAAAAVGGGTSQADPIVVKVTIANASLLSGTNSQGTDPLHKLFDAIPSGKYVSYDLSDSTFTTIADISSQSITVARTNRAYFAFITLPNTLTSIGTYVFKDSSGLISVAIPNSVTSIGSLAFQYCNSLTSITVDSGNSHYKSIDGVLFNKAGTTLIKYPGGKTGAYTIPAGVSSIGQWAFAACHGLTSVTKPNSVTSIGSQAFALCYGLTSVTIPNSVTLIGSQVFVDCVSLTSVIMQPSVPPTLSSNTFEFVPASLKIKVTSGLLAAYTTNNTVDGWTADIKAKVEVE